MNKNILKYLCLGVIWSNFAIDENLDIDEQFEIDYWDAWKSLSRRQRKIVNRFFKGSAKINKVLRYDMPSIVKDLKDTFLQPYPIYIRIIQYRRFKYLIKKGINKPGVLKSLNLSDEYNLYYENQYTVFNHNKKCIESLLKIIKRR